MSGAPDPMDQVRLATFWRTLRLATPRVWVMRAIVGLNVAVFVAMMADGVSALDPTVGELRSWGANFGPDTLGGEYWRLFTATFLHVGVLHLAINMYVLYAIGDMVERLLGNLGFAAMYVVSGLVGSVASVVWNPVVTSAGASGAVFGVYGALFGFLVLRRDSIPASALKSLLKTGVFFVGINMAFGLSVPGIDVAAHVGGLVAGFVCGMAMSHPMTKDGVSGRGRRSGLVAALGLALVAATVGLLPNEGAERQESIQAFERDHATLVQTYAGALERHQRRELSADGFARVVANDILPAWRDLAARVPDVGELKPRLERYVKLREDAFALEVEAIAAGDRRRFERAEALHREANTIWSRLTGPPTP